MNLSWELLWGVGALLLLAVLAYGVTRNKTRNRANDAVTEEATREEYSHPDSYRQREKALKEKLDPS